MKINNLLALVKQYNLIFLLKVQILKFLECFVIKYIKITWTHTYVVSIEPCFVMEILYGTKKHLFKVLIKSWNKEL